jgi:hypothetical protein
MLEAHMMTRMLGRAAALFAATILLSLTAACGSDKSTGPDMGDVAGSYDATTLTVTEAGTSHDVIADGATIHLVLDEDGTTSGHLTIPASDLSDGEAVDADMTGSWTLDGAVVHITQSADTFVRDLPLTVEGDRRSVAHPRCCSLTGDATFDDHQVHLVMSRQ